MATRKLHRFGSAGAGRVFAPVLAFAFALVVASDGRASTIVNPLHAGSSGIHHGDAYAWDNAVADAEAGFISGDGTGDGAYYNWGDTGTKAVFVGQRNAASQGWHRLERALFKFALPTLSAGQQVQSATLRLYLIARPNFSSESEKFSVVLKHSQSDNTDTSPPFGASSYQNASYDLDLGIIATPETAQGQYLSIDVTSALVSDYQDDAAASEPLIAAFRLQADSLTYDHAVPTRTYNFAASNDAVSTSQWAELELAFTTIPEPTAAGMLGFGMLLLSYRRQRQCSTVQAPNL